MLTIKTLRTVLASAAALAGLPCHAALQARSLDADPATIEAYYDTVLDITWLADAGASRAAGPSGLLTFNNAQNWASGLDFGGITGWRMPTADPSCPLGGYDCSSPADELGYMFYANLGGQAGHRISEVHNANYDLFTDLRDQLYWSNTPYNASIAYALSFGTGAQNVYYRTNTLGAWAVRDGDIAPVPEPQSGALLLAGIAGVMCWRRRGGVSPRVQ